MKMHRTRILPALLVLLVLLTLVPVSAFAADTVPSGYTAVSTPEQLDNIRNNMSGKYILTADIDLSTYLGTKGWSALGYTSATKYTAFTGILDGNGHTIRGLKLASAGKGLIYRNEGTIKNLTLVGTSTASTSYGVFCTLNYGTIQNCHNKVAVTSTFHTSAKMYMGGITMGNYSGAVIEGCSNQAALDVNVWVGGSSMSDKNVHVGGIAGINSGTIRKCCNAASVTATANGGTSSYAGGIVGKGNNNSVIENCYNRASVSALRKNVGDTTFSHNVLAGGLMGTSENNTDVINIKTSYNAGNVKGYSAYYDYDNSGNLVGYAPGTKYTNCYYLEGMLYYASASTSKPKGTTQLTATQMRSQSSFSGFDFNNVWSMGSSGGYYYPVHQGSCTHSLDYVAAKAATCTEDGNIAHYYCNICKRYFGNTAKTKEYTKTQVVIAAAHSWTEAEELEARLVPGSNCQTLKEYYYGCANCDAVSDTEKFTGTAYGDHQMSADWTTEDEKHFHACTVTGCDHKEDEESCYGGTATCTERALCQVCNQPHGSTLDHDWTEAEELEERLVPGSGADCQHAKQYYYGCTGCDAVSDSEFFTGSTKGSHQMSEDWTTENEKHFHACTVTGCAHKEDEEGCYGGTATCTASALCQVCNQPHGSTLAHDWTEKEETEERLVPNTGIHCQSFREYYYGCTGCDAVSTTETFVTAVAGSHQMSTGWTTENEKHFHACTVTGCDHKEDEEGCYGGTATCTASALCQVCNQPHGSTLDHDWTEKEETAERLVPGSGADCQSAKQYYYGCTGCDAVSDTETFAGSTCGDHKPSQTWQHDESGHYKVCTVPGCGQQQGREDHDWNDATCHAPKTCQVCGRTEGQPADHIPTGWKHDKDSHWKTCTREDCQAILDKGAHTDKNSDAKCDTCGRAMQVDDPDVPDTGDEAATALWLTVLMISGTLALCLIRKVRVS